MERFIYYDITNTKSFIDRLLGFFVYFTTTVLFVEDYLDNSFKNTF